MNWKDVLKLVGPMVVSVAVPGGAVIAPLIIHAVEQAESMKGASGAEKREKAIDLIAVGVAGANAVAGKMLIDPAKVAEAVGSGIDAVVQTVNLVHSVHHENAGTGGKVEEG